MAAARLRARAALLVPAFVLGAWLAVAFVAVVTLAFTSGFPRPSLNGMKVSQQQPSTRSALTSKARRCVSPHPLEPFNVWRADACAYWPASWFRARCWRRRRRRRRERDPDDDVGGGEALDASKKYLKYDDRVGCWQGVVTPLGCQIGCVCTLRASLLVVTPG
jgi:hypothetical protein